MSEEIFNRIFNFFTESSDFNGMPLRSISDEFEIAYVDSIDLIKNLVKDELVSIQSSTNPHIILFQHYSIEDQMKILEDAKNTEVTIQDFGAITIATENTEFPICLYPSKRYLQINRDLSKFENVEYTKQLALGEPQLKPIFFEIEVLERYSIDPRFDFKFEDYSGKISYKYDENGNAILREEDQVFMETFGLGIDANGERLAAVYLRYLKGLTKEHQAYWKSKEAKGECKILKDYRDNTVGGSWNFSPSIFTAFIEELKWLNKLSVVIFDKNLFRKTFEEDERPKEFTFFFTPTLKNYNEFILLLDKMISENIDKSFFEGQIALFELNPIEAGIVERKPKGTLRLLEEWLLLRYKVDDQELIRGLIGPLKKVRKERQSPAHRIDENVYDKTYTTKQKEMMNTVYSSIRMIREVFQRHPKAREVSIPKWLEEGRIKVF